MRGAIPADLPLIAEGVDERENGWVSCGRSWFRPADHLRPRDSVESAAEVGTAHGNCLRNSMSKVSTQQFLARHCAPDHRTRLAVNSNNNGYDAPSKL